MSNLDYGFQPIQSQNKECIQPTKVNTNKELKNCPACGGLVAKSAKKCPHCGKKLKKSKLAIGCGTIILIILVLIGSLVIKGKILQNNKDNLEKAKYDAFFDYIEDNGDYSSGKYTLKTSLDSIGLSTDGSVSISVDSFENIYINYTTYNDSNNTIIDVTYKSGDEEASAVCKQIFNTYTTTSTGSVDVTTFTYSNQEYSVKNFYTDNAPFGQSNAKDSLGVEIGLAFGTTNLMFIKTNAGISLSDAGISYSSLN